ncbi:hypothetical protein [Leptospira harrisiae]|uniref:Uncharacterized protein n=1 Tax=Leptospira harrisiae TaxID=2023189 RepID=A0A2N0AKS7_9LEPT|nr:hypothetical protein [Leptospira harrisiae]PJZ84873.1 hypothetical protein CH364_00915 [Leptospira harrisiae]PKA08376.1 hypothetical protein CH366_00915 [Leptospira harrisiae]
MFHKKIILTLGVVFLSFGSLLAKDYDSTHELPEVIQPDKHRVYIRGNVGYGGLYFPGMDYVKNEIYTGLALGSYTVNNLSQFGKLKDANEGTSRQFDIEYRYMDKFRIFRESRTLVNEIPNDDFRKLQFKEKSSSLGVAYFHPLTPHLNIGVSLRQVDIDQITRKNYGTFDFGFINYTTSVSLLSAINREFNMNVKGIVPGLHIEIKPLRWFEIHFGKQFYNLSGNDVRSTLIIDSYRVANISNVIPYLEASNGSVGYTGEKTTLDFVFRFSSWFATKWGYTVERYTMKYKNYFIYTGNIESSMLYSAIEGSQKQKFEYGSMNFTLEFSKSFGE